MHLGDLLRALLVGTCLLLFALLCAVTGRPPLSLFEAMLFAFAIVLVSARGGFSWGLMCLLAFASSILFLQGSWRIAFWYAVLGVLWYVGATFLAARGSRVLMGLSTGMLFFGMTISHVPSLSFRGVLFYIGLLCLAISGTYFFGIAERAR